MGKFLPEEFEGIETFCSFYQDTREVLYVGDQTFGDEIYYVDSSFFKVFNYTFIEGNRDKAMHSPKSIVLTEAMARKYFGEAEALGRMIEVGKEKIPYLVTGIVQDDKRNSHLRASVWISKESEDYKSYGWASAGAYTYVLLRTGYDQEDLEEALDRIIANHVYPDLGPKFGKASLQAYNEDESTVKFQIQPLTDIHFKSKAFLELSAGGNQSNTYIFSGIAILILVLAAVNFINLSTARAARRAKEVGIRKSLGTTRQKLIVQFLSESIIISVFSMILAFCFAELFSLIFFWITGQHLPVSIWSNALSLGGVFVFCVLVGILAGLYPAFYLTAFNPVKVLKGNLQQSRSHSFRNILVIFQFSISVSLIICTSIIIRQLNFMSNRDLGFNQENVLVVDNLSLLKDSKMTFRDQLMQQAQVMDGSLHSGEPGRKKTIISASFSVTGMPNAISMNAYYGDYNYLNVLGIKLIAGRNFDKNLASDTASVIFNEAAVKMLGLPENPIGVMVNEKLKVIGVVNDFHWESLRNSIAPIAIFLQTDRNTFLQSSQLALKLKSSDASTVLKTAEAKWKQLVPEQPFTYHFLDENFGQFLKKEEELGKAVGFFTVLAIFISCLGLFGLCAYIAEQRTKEIGIRKVLGATVFNIVFMLNRQFTRLVLISICIAIPISYYATREWLSGFAYKTNLNTWIFIAGGALGLLIGCGTVAFHSIKASQNNPAETLKCE